MRLLAGIQLVYYVPGSPRNRSRLLSGSRGGTGQGRRLQLRSHSFYLRTSTLSLAATIPVLQRMPDPRERTMSLLPRVLSRAGSFVHRFRAIRRTRGIADPDRLLDFFEPPSPGAIFKPLQKRTEIRELFRRVSD